MLERREQPAQGRRGRSAAAVARRSRGRARFPRRARRAANSPSRPLKTRTRGALAQAQHIGEIGLLAGLSRATSQPARERRVDEEAGRGEIVGEAWRLAIARWTSGARSRAARTASPRCCGRWRLRSVSTRRRHYRGPTYRCCVSFRLVLADSRSVARGGAPAAANEFCDKELAPMMQERKALIERLSAIGKRAKEPGRPRPVLRDAQGGYIGNIDRSRSTTWSRTRNSAPCRTRRSAGQAGPRAEPDARKKICLGGRRTGQQQAAAGPARHPARRRSSSSCDVTANGRRSPTQRPATGSTAHAPALRPPPISRPRRRADRPIGWLAAALAVLVVGGAGRRSRQATSPVPNLWHLVLFLVGAIAMRGAGCTYNDIVDRDIDARVERTRSRPLPFGQVGLPARWYFWSLQAWSASRCCCSSTASPSCSASLRSAIVAVYPVHEAVHLTGRRSCSASPFPGAR